uniref:Uncharacterized protein n=1 Tax=Oryza barthii TaxID=65489 RepID=A0A0D3HM14_9ORYZ
MWRLGESRTSKLHLTWQSIAPQWVQYIKVALISITPYDAVGVQFLHSNVLVISATIADYKVKKVLVDLGSSVDVLFMHSFDQLHL